MVSGDCKFDQTPTDGRPTDVARLAELGQEGVLALLLDSTNVERPGITPSERVVGERFQHLFAEAPGRVLVTPFTSNVHRLQQAFDKVLREVRLKRGDTVVFRASPIPGNEALVARTINHLFKHGADVVYGPASGAHVSDTHPRRSCA